MADDLRISIGADPSQLEHDLNRAEEMIDRFVSKIERIGEVGDQLKSLGTRLTASITLPIIGLGAAAIKAYGDVEALQKGLEAVMGSAESAGAEFEKLKEVAKLPGLGLKEVVKGSVALQAAGFSASQARRSLLIFGNALATVGKGGRELDLVNLALTQLQNKASGFGQDLRQLTEQLPQLRNALTNAFGTSDSKAISEMGITGAEVVRRITDEFEKLPKVTGGINNAFENLSDSMKTSLARIGKIINDNFDISGIIDKITGFIEKAVDAFESLDPAIQKSIIVVAGLAAAAGPLLVVIGSIIAAIPTLTAGIGALSAAFTFLTGPIGLVTVGIVGIVAAVVTHWDKIKPYLVETVNNFIDIYNESKRLRLGLSAIGFAFEAVWTGVKIGLEAIWNTIKSFGKAVLELFAGMSQALKGVFNLNTDDLKTGLSRGFGAINGFALDSSKIVRGAFSYLGSSIDGLEKKWSKLEKISKIGSANSPVQVTPPDPEQVAGSIIDAAKEAAKKVKDKKNEIPKIEPIEFNSRGFLDQFGNEYKSLNDLLSKETQRTQMILNKQLPTILEESELNFLKISARMEDIKKKFNEELSNILEESTISSISNIFSSIGDAIANGSGVISAIGTSLLSSLGDIMVQLGQLAIKTGVGILAIKTALKTLNPFVAIAAGAALIALGSAVKGSVKALGNSVGGGSGSISTSTGGGSNTYSSTYTSGGNFSGEVVFRISGQDLVGVLNRANNSNSRLNAGN